MSTEYDHLIKILMIGDSGVGKTCLLLRYTEDTFNSTHLATIGIDFKLKMMKMNEKTFKLQIWDTAGQERFRTITQTYYRGAMGIVLAYDCTSEFSFNNMKNWVDQIKLFSRSDVALVLIANKSDSPSRLISFDQGKELADELGIAFYETSAKKNVNVQEVFEHIAGTVVSNKLDDHNRQSIHLSTADITERKCCASNLL